MKLLITFLTLGISLSAFAKTQPERIDEVFNELRADKMEILDDFYAPEVEFIDPVGKHNGLAEVKKYYSNLYKNVVSIRFEFHDIISQDNKHTAIWTMYLKSKNLEDGKEISLSGNSVIIFNEDNLVSYHRDYFDMGEFIYERVPFVGWLVKKVKARLQAH